MLTKTCAQCQISFYIPPEDLTYYESIAVEMGGKKLSIPEPTLCPNCRHQKRLSFRNEMHLYHRKCDATGKQIISMYSPDKPYKIYDQHVWWSDDWDPLSYGQDFDFNKTFFEQYKELQLKVPRMSLNNIKPENSDYSNYALSNKNSYLVYTADYNENSCYLRFSDRNYQCFDCDYTYNSTECYNCIDVEKGNRLVFCQKCSNSNDMYFCYNMVSCQDCIGSANLRNKQYCIFNVQYTKEEYEKKKAEFDFNNESRLQEFKKEFEEFLKTQPRKYLEIINSEGSIGDNIRDSKSARYCYNAIDLEDCSYMINCYNAKNCYDWDFVGLSGSINCHEMVSSALNMVNCHFSANCWENCNEMYYCELSLNSSNLFGCIGLRHKKYCILNKQYTKEEYEEIVPRIIEHMRKTGEWGEFFPVDLSPFAYNESVASEYFPLTEEQAKERSLKWFNDEEERLYRGSGGTLPESTQAATEDICKEIFVCATSGKPYKIIRQELEACKSLGISLPRLSPRERHRTRMSLRNPWSLWNRTCSNCSTPIQTTYAPDRPEPVYCEKCYLEAVY